MTRTSSPVLPTPLSRRTALHAASALCLAWGTLALPTTATAQPAPGAYPSKTIRFVVPYPPGGPTDLMARMLQPELQSRLGVPVVVDNKGGAGGTIGASEAVRARPDGYTLSVATKASGTTTKAGDTQNVADTVTTSRNGSSISENVTGTSTLRWAGVDGTTHNTWNGDTEVTAEGYYYASEDETILQPVARKDGETVDQITSTLR